MAAVKILSVIHTKKWLFPKCLKFVRLIAVTMKSFGELVYEADTSLNGKVPVDVTSTVSHLVLELD
jgi:hypothetical protein